MGFPGSASRKGSACQCRRCRRPRFDPWVGKFPWSRKWHRAAVHLPGKFHGQRTLRAIVHGASEMDTGLSD